MRYYLFMRIFVGLHMRYVNQRIFYKYSLVYIADKVESRVINVNYLLELHGQNSLFV